MWVRDRTGFYRAGNVLACDHPRQPLDVPLGAARPMPVDIHRDGDRAERLPRLLRIDWRLPVVVDPPPFDDDAVKARPRALPAPPFLGTRLVRLDPLRCPFGVERSPASRASRGCAAAECSAATAGEKEMILGWWNGPVSRNLEGRRYLIATEEGRHPALRTVCVCGVIEAVVDELIVEVAAAGLAGTSGGHGRDAIGRWPGTRWLGGLDALRGSVDDWSQPGIEFDSGRQRAPLPKRPPFVLRAQE